jgi:dUTP pyrophosphatase
MQLRFLDDRLAEFKPATELSAGYDLRACIDKDIYIPPGGQEKIKTGVALNMITEGMMNELQQSGTADVTIVPCAIVMPRSGLGCKGVKPRNTPGLIDADYQGEVIVCLYNEGNDTVHINPMDRIAQLVFTIALHPFMEIVTEFSNQTERGANGFGSTGKQ